MQHKHIVLKRLTTAALLVALAGCGVTDRIGKRMEDSWAADMLADSEKVILTSDGGNQLNPDAEGRPLSVVMRVYQLTDLERFAATDAETLWDAPQKALGNTLVETREITLLPGIGQIDQWPLAKSARYVGVAAFFRDEHDARWKVAFDANSLRKDGIWFSSDGLRVLVDNTEISAMRGVDVLNKPPTADQLAAAQKAKDADTTLTDKMQDAVVDKATDAASQSASNAMDSTFNSLVDSVK
ncbi:type VI secretion system lipoprotein TssJ [Pseudomonas sp. CJQ_7]|jgi:type VI secretion system protein VasD|uniref:Type VI secretion system lipoprotein TssJ n=1 Tax=Pseudomonas monteilii TaxID=76759 RepID=A0A2N1IWF3_9PSED|nr:MULTISPECIES: type VI secretion system lipoprotein TssJ [Pseudomonas]EKT4457711.1 type VI secretion system lipoprotein TssJ [Pseudomonas putida]EKT4471338.1 type VI secretion system lipoprotein TssJ [Pseudomonas putida]EKT4493551.1 type VI secretion system lipoprotein TssJ [Pseudomonas putida]EKT4512591.1 type VI secretion system lipoprotein TssJ [Pseudomonas putida]EKT4530827.1 type VI secretion system lipoprotein TssJ [Pseudomonas putida]